MAFDRGAGDLLFPAQLRRGAISSREYRDVRQNPPRPVRRTPRARLPRNAQSVALESTIITHGMPYPKNLETALMLEDVGARGRRDAGHRSPSSKAASRRPRRRDAGAAGASFRRRRQGLAPRSRGGGRAPRLRGHHGRRDDVYRRTRGDRDFRHRRHRRRASRRRGDLRHLRRPRRTRAHHGRRRLRRRQIDPRCRQDRWNIWNRRACAVCGYRCDEFPGLLRPHQRPSSSTTDSTARTISRA